MLVGPAAGAFAASAQGGRPRSAQRREGHAARTARAVDATRVGDAEAAPRIGGHSQRLFMIVREQRKLEDVLCGGSRPR